MKTFACMRPVLSVKEILSAVAIVFAVSLVRAQEFPPKHQILRHSVNAAGQGVYALVATAVHFNKVKKYEILNPGEHIVLLRLREQKGKITEVRSFFNRNGSDFIIPLTLKNLKREFPGETDFHKKLDLLSKNNSQLIKYQYCINRIYRNSAGSDQRFRNETAETANGTF